MLAPWNWLALSLLVWPIIGLLDCSSAGCSGPQLSWQTALNSGVRETN